MQISIYLEDPIIKKIDRLAKKKNRSRSRLIQEILKKEILGKGNESVFDEIFGVLSISTAEEIIQTIRTSRHDSPRFG